jgi:tRNA(Phe) wybutosine-synthesizing methylase Tyw3
MPNCLNSCIHANTVRACEGRIIVISPQTVIHNVNKTIIIKYHISQIVLLEFRNIYYE